MAYTEASKRATIKYQREHLKQVPIRFQFSEYEELKHAADQAGLPVATFMKQAIRAAIDQASTAAAPAAAGQGVPVGESGGVGVGRVTPVNTANEEKPSSK